MLRHQPQHRPEQAAYGAGRADHRHRGSGIEGVVQRRAGDTAEQVERQHAPAADGALHAGAEGRQHDHVDQDVQRAAVQELVRDRRYQGLPAEPTGQVVARGNEAEVEQHLRHPAPGHHGADQVDRHVRRDQHAHHRGQVHRRLARARRRRRRHVVGTDAHGSRARVGGAERSRAALAATARNHGEAAAR